MYTLLSQHTAHRSSCFTFPPLILSHFGYPPISRPPRHLIFPISAPLTPRHSLRSPLHLLHRVAMFISRLEFPRSVKPGLFPALVSPSPFPASAGPMASVSARLLHGHLLILPFSNSHLPTHKTKLGKQSFLLFCPGLYSQNLGQYLTLS